jgi:hypothetical protein
MEDAPVKHLRCESSVIPQDAASGENAAQCGDDRPPLCGLRQGRVPATRGQV